MIREKFGYIEKELKKSENQRNGSFLRLLYTNGEYPFISDSNDFFLSRKISEKNKFEIFKNAFKVYEDVIINRDRSGQVDVLENINAYDYYCKNFGDFSKNYKVYFNKAFKKIGVIQFNDSEKEAIDNAALIVKALRKQFDYYEIINIVTDLLINTKLDFNKISIKYSYNDFEKKKCIDNIKEFLPKRNSYSICEDILCANYTFDLHDCRLTTSIVYQNIICQVYNSFETYVYTKDPVLIRKIIKSDLRSDNRIIFVLEDYNKTKIYGRLYKSSVQYEFINSYKLKERLNDNRPFNLAIVDNYIDFNNHSDIYKDITLVFDLFKNNIQNLLVYSFDKQFFKYEPHFAKNIEDSGLSINNVYYLPQDIKECTSGQRIIVSANNRCAPGFNAYRFSKNNYNSLKLDSYSKFCLTNSDFNNELRKTFDNEKNNHYKKTDTTKHKLEPYSYSSCIKWSRSISKNKISGKYQCHCSLLMPDNNIENYKDLTYVENTLRHKDFNTYEDAKSWCENEYLFAKSNRSLFSPIDAARATFKEVLSRRSIDIKSFITIYDNVYDRIPSRIKRVLKKSVFEFFSEIPMDYLSFEKIAKCINENINKEDKEDEEFVEKLYGNLKYIFDRAINYEHLSRNPIEGTFGKTESEIEAEIKAALLKKQFSKNESGLLLLKALDSKILSDEEKLTFIIRLLTSLGPKYTLCLQNEDYVTNEMLGYSSLLINKELDNVDSNNVSYMDEESYLFPVSKELNMLLFNYLQSNNSENIFDNNGSIFVPKKISKNHYNFVDKTLNTKDLIITVHGKDKNKQINLSYDQGDKFRTNFAYLAHIVSFYDSEIIYFLMNKQEFTYAKNYLDYMNPYIQYQLYLKVNRIENILTKKDIYKYCKFDFKNVQTITMTDNNNSLMTYEIELEIDEDDEVVIELDSKYGMDILVIEEDYYE